MNVARLIIRARVIGDDDDEASAKKLTLIIISLSRDSGSSNVVSYKHRAHLYTSLAIYYSKVYSTAVVAAGYLREGDVRRSGPLL